METEQFNIRISKDLVEDIDMISKLLNVNKSDWVKNRLAQEVHTEKSKLLMELSTLYAKGAIGKDRVARLVGKDIANEMESIKRTAIESIRHGIKHGKKERRLRS